MGDFSWDDVLLAIENALATAWGWLMQVLTWVSSWLQYLVNVAEYIWGALWWVVEKIVDGFKWLASLKFSDIWNGIKKAFDYYRRFRKWWQTHVQAAIDAYRRQILAIYRQFFKPIIGVIEAVRSAVRVIAVFNRKLAAKLDAKLWQIEGWILTPITRALRSVNGMASILYAILTATGRIDATVFIATVCRHITEIRAALFGLPWKNNNLPADTRPAQNAQIASDFTSWLHSGGGSVQDGVDAMEAEFQDALTRMGVTLG